MDWITSDFSALNCTPEEPSSTRTRNLSRLDIPISKKEIEAGKPSIEPTRCLEPEALSISRDVADEADVCIVTDETTSRKRSLTSNAISKRLKVGTSRHPSALEDYGAKMRASINTSQQLWIDKYQPKTKNDLAVNIKKIREVEDWLKNLQKGTSQRILVLNGPSGSGKSTTARVLCKELQIDVLDLENPESCAWDPDGDNSSYRTIPAMFEEFLRSAKYGRAQYGPSGGSPTGAACSSVGSGGSVTLIEVCGSMVIHICKFLVIDGIIFVVSENNASNSRFWTLFPDRTIAQLGITVVKFNPIIVTKLKKHFTTVTKKEMPEAATNLSPHQLDELVAQCRGDIRAGLTALEFSVDSHRKVSKSTQRKIELNKNDRDESLLLFRAVGRAFYVKRNLDQPVNKVGLPSHLAIEARLPLTYVPEEIIDKCATSVDNYVAFTHENYPWFINEVESLERAADVFSLAAYMNSDWTSEEETNFALKNCAASVVIRGLLQLQRGKTNNQYHPVAKPAATEIRKKTEERKAHGRSLLLDICPSVRTSMAFAEIFPYWGKIASIRGTAGAFLREMSSITHATSRREELRQEEWFESSVRRPKRRPAPYCHQNHIAEIDLQFSDIFGDDDNDLEATNLHNPSHIQIEEMDDD